MMWPVYSVIVWGTFLGGPHVRLGFDEASSSGTFVGGTLWPLLSFGIVGGVNAGILYTQLPDWAKFLLTAAVGVIYILLWSHIAPKPG